MYLAKRLAGKGSKMNYLCQVGCKTLTQSINLQSHNHIDNKKQNTLG